MNNPADPDPFGRSADLNPTARSFARAMFLSGIVFIVGGIVAGIALEPVLFVVAAVGVADLVVARLVSNGKLKIG